MTASDVEKLREGGEAMMYLRGLGLPTNAELLTSSLPSSNDHDDSSQIIMCMNLASLHYSGRE